MHQQLPKQKSKQYYFLFINSKSGGGKGMHYLTIPQNRLEYQYSDDILLTLYMIDLFKEKERERALAKMKNIMQNIQENKAEHKQIRVVICGGDGTVIWVVELIAKYGIDTSKIIFTIIPMGTGNDFSRCLGWGGSPIRFSSQNTDPLKNRIIQWLSGEESFYDLWNIELTTFQDGTIYHIRDKIEQDTKKQELNRGFCNYFGLGIDARIAYSVELKRQRNKWLNLVLYGCIGFCKLFKKIQKTSEAVRQFKVGNYEEEEIQYQKEQRMVREEEASEIVYEGGQEEKNNKGLNQPLLTEPNSSEIRLKEGYCSILALNSVRYMAGLKNVWNTKTLGVKTDKGHSQFTEQRFNDGKIEFIAFKNELRLGLERIINSGARIAQGEGPFTILFNRFEGQGADDTMFVHIDGQAMKVKHLKSIVIKKNQLIKDGRIRVLLRKEDQ